MPASHRGPTQPGELGKLPRGGAVSAAPRKIQKSSRGFCRKETERGRQRGARTCKGPEAGEGLVCSGCTPETAVPSEGGAGCLEGRQGGQGHLQGLGSPRAGLSFIPWVMGRRFAASWPVRLAIEAVLSARAWSRHSRAWQGHRMRGVTVTSSAGSHMTRLQVREARCRGCFSEHRSPRRDLALSNGEAVLVENRKQSERTIWVS